MRESNDVFDRLGRSFLSLMLESTDSKKEGGETKLILIGVALFSYLGNEVIKVVFRQNFGSNGLSLLKSILASLSFVLWAIIALLIIKNDSEELSWVGNQTTLNITFGTYIVLAIFVIVKAVAQKAKPNERANPNYRGDSKLLSFLMKEGWSQAKVQNMAEPASVLALGVFLSAISLMLGLPLVFCALSVWLHSLIESFFGLSQLRDELAESGSNPSGQKGFSQIM